MSQEDQEKINDLIFTGHKVAAIKLYRSMTGCDLKIATKYIEYQIKELKRTSPQHFKQDPRPSAKPMIFIFLIAMVICLYLGFRYAKNIF